jgi:hypothetical protein
MTQLSDTLNELRELHAEIARVDDLIAKHPQYESLLVDRDSLLKRQRTLEHIFDALTDEQMIDVCRYSFVPEESDRYPLLSLTKILTEFQELFTAVFDAVKTGKPKVRAKSSADIVQQSSFDFGYTAAGSLRVALMVPNERLLAVETELDRSIELVFQAMKAKEAREITELTPVIGIAAVKKLYELADDHAKYALSADIQWRRRGEIRRRVTIQPPQFEQLRAEINKKTEKKIETIRLHGRLVGLDVEVGTFHMTFPEAEDISGRLAESYTGGKPAEVPGNYAATIRKESVIYYSTQEDIETYFLVELTRPK